ncbi:hypothetical protein ACHAWF_018690 [Thalassiosira exigua]
MCRTPAQPRRQPSAATSASTLNGLTKSPWRKLPLLLLRWPYRITLFLFAGVLFSATYLVDTETCSPTPIGDALFGDRLSLLRRNVRETFACGRSLRGFELGRTERVVMFVFAAIGVFGDILPKYLRDDVAKRHVKQRKANRWLLVHIASGTISVIGGGVAGMLGGFDDTHSSLLFWGFCASDFVHQLSICVLCKNHDGIWVSLRDECTCYLRNASPSRDLNPLFPLIATSHAQPLRLGNYVLLAAKFEALANHHHFTGTQFADVIFTITFGALGTRLASAMSYVGQLLLKREQQLKLEVWYSLGLSLALLYIVCRIPNFDLYFFGCMTLVSHLYYHEIWPRRNKRKFVAFNAALSVACMGFVDSECIRTVVLVFYFIGAGFMQPRFYRCPEEALASDALAEKEKERNAEAFRRRMMNRLNSHMTSMRMSSRSLRGTPSMRMSDGSPRGD